MDDSSGDTAARRQAPVVPTGASAGEALEVLQELTLLLREACPWDRAQSHLSIVPHTVSEALEVADTVRANASPSGTVSSSGAAELEDELGDLLFQVVLLSVLSAEVDPDRTLTGVIGSIVAKLVRRHPHVFAKARSETADEVRATWEAVKRTGEGRRGTFGGLPTTLPATHHARTAQQRAAGIGFDFPSVRDAHAKVEEERRELAEAIEDELARRGDPPGESEVPSAAAHHEVGDLLFATVNTARLLGVDPELALRDCTRRFVDRVETAEALAAESGEDFADLDIERQEHWYQRARQQLGATSA